ncbi:MAG TPA: hypothetical protein VH395_12655 [Jatrophihabitantaceae bacterium]
MESRRPAMTRAGVQDVSSLPAERTDRWLFPRGHDAASTWTRGGTRLDVLDIGSNSAQLEIVDLRHGGPPLPAYAVKEPTLLGEEITDEGR